MHLKIISKFEGKVKIEVNETVFFKSIALMNSAMKDLMELIEIPNLDKTDFYNEIRETQDFYRRIPHFFMGRFKKWSKVINDMETHKFLVELQMVKKSKQGRYELGDLHKQNLQQNKRSFQQESTDSFNRQQTKKKVKDLFIEFLQNEAVIQIIHYNKISSIEQKNKYIKSIPHLIDELYEDKPFDQFLAQNKISSELQKEINQKYQNKKIKLE